MWDNPFEFKYDAKGDYYDIVVDKKKIRDRGQVCVPQRIRRSASGLLWGNSNYSHVVNLKRSSSS